MKMLGESLCIRISISEITSYWLKTIRKQYTVTIILFAIRAQYYNALGSWLQLPWRLSTNFQFPSMFFGPTDVNDFSVWTVYKPPPPNLFLNTPLQHHKICTCTRPLILLFSSETCESRVSKIAVNKII